EAEYLFKARNSFTNNSALADRIKTNSVAVLLSDKGLSGPARAAIASSILNYCSLIQIGQQSFFLDQALLVQLEYTRAEVASQQALLQWQALVAGPINQLVGYYSSGVKPDQWAQTILTVAGLAAIAWRL